MRVTHALSTVRIQVVNAVLQIHCLYVYVSCIHKRRNRLCQDHKINIFHCRMCSITLHKTFCMCKTYIFETELFPNTTFNGGNTWVRQNVAMWHCLQWADQHVLSLVFCKIVVSESRFVVGALQPLALPGSGHVSEQRAFCRMFVSHYAALYPKQT